MIIFYLIAIVCSLSLIVPSNYLSEYIKWPIALAAIIIITYLFNACKKDTIYTTRPTKNVVIKRGLFHPLMMYSSFILYLTGFLGIYSVCQEKGVVNIAEDYLILFTNIDNRLIYAVIVIGLAILLNNVFKWILSKVADTTTIKERSFFYVVVFVIVSIAIIYNMLNYDMDSFNQFIGSEHNYFIFYAIPLLMILVDLAVTISTGVKIRRKKKGIISARKAARIAKLEARAEAKLNKENAVRNRRLAKYEAEKAKDEAKFAAKVVRYETKVAKRNAKIQAKLDAKAAKKAAKYAEQDAKIRIKIAKVRLNNEKKADKLVAKYDKKTAKLARREMKQAEKEAIKQAEIDSKLQRKLAKKNSKLDKKAYEIQVELRELIAENV